MQMIAWLFSKSNLYNKTITYNIFKMYKMHKSFLQTQYCKFWSDDVTPNALKSANMKELNRMASIGLDRNMSVIFQRHERLELTCAVDNIIQLNLEKTKALNDIRGETEWEKQTQRER